MAPGGAFASPRYASEVHRAPTNRRGEHLMRRIYVIPAIRSAAGPPLSSARDGAGVFLKQGDLDGACGPYCLLMAMLAFNLVARGKITGSSGLDKRTNVFKFFAGLEEQAGPLAKNGTSGGDIALLVEKSFGKTLRCRRIEEATEVRDFAVRQVTRGHAVLLWIRGKQELSHWVLAIGVERSVDAPKGSAEALLVLDPLGSPPEIAAWNGVIRLSSKENHKLIPDGRSVQFVEALAVWPVVG